jgi:hypothetical protein
MRRHLGRVSLAGAATSWALLVLALVSGGLDPPPGRTPLLRAATASALCLSLLALGTAILALARGPERASAALGLILSSLFLLYFTGFGFALAALFR